MTEVEKVKRRNSLCGILALIFSTLLNLIHFPLFVVAFIEQIQTGWGYGTDLEMGVLFWWLAEYVMIIPLLTSAGLFVASMVKRDYKAKIVINAALLALCVFQIVISNLFFIY